MKKFFNDFKAATAFFRDLRRQKSETYPCIVTEYCFLDTVEGTVLFNCGREIYKKVQEFFKALPHEMKKSLVLSYGDGYYIDRANFWRDAFKSVLNEKEYQIATRRVIRWYIHCKQLKMKGA